MSLPKPREGWLLGVDVSRFQGAIDAAALLAHDVDFLFARATDGLHTIDENFAATAAACVAEGLPFGAYGVIEPYGPEKAEAQARHFVAVAKDSGATLPPVLDFELARGISASSALAAARRWLDVVEEQLERTAIIYTGPAFWLGLLTLANHGQPSPDAEAIARRPLWVAHYGVAAPHVPRPWDDWTIWQASGNGAATLPGTRVEVDVDWYRGSVDELLALGRRETRAPVAQQAG